MGNNLDLCQMLGVPDEVLCPRCHTIMSSYFDDYDIECGSPNLEPGRWSLRCYCQECEHEWYIKFDVVPQLLAPLKPRPGQQEPEMANWIDLYSGKLSPYVRDDYNEPVALTAPEVRRLLLWVRFCWDAEDEARKTREQLHTLLKRIDDALRDEQKQLTGQESYRIELCRRAVERAVKGDT